jgi:hypothetical protein
MTKKNTVSRYVTPFSLLLFSNVSEDSAAAIFGWKSESRGNTDNSNTGMEIKDWG